MEGFSVRTQKGCCNKNVRPVYLWILLHKHSKKREFWACIGCYLYELLAVFGAKIIEADNNLTIADHHLVHKREMER